MHSGGRSRDQVQADEERSADASLDQWIGGGRSASRQASRAKAEIDPRKHSRETFATGVIPHADEIGSARNRQRAKDETKLKAPFAELLKDLGPHQARAFSVVRILQDGISVRDFERVLEALPTAAIVLDAEAKLCYVNHPARALIQTGQVMLLDRTGALVFSDPAADLAMDGLTTALARRDFSAIPTQFEAADTAYRARYKISTVPFALESKDGDVRGLFDARGRPAALIFIEPSVRDREQAARMALALRYGLTPTEADLSWALYVGQTLAQIAERRNVSIHTVRNQLKAVFHKTGIGRQSQLVSLVSEITASTRSDIS